MNSPLTSSRRCAQSSLQPFGWVHNKALFGCRKKRNKFPQYASLVRATSMDGGQNLQFVSGKLYLHGKEMLHDPLARSHRFPQVDWSRHHLQILFVDHDDMGAARIAKGLFEEIAGWNGLGRALCASTCGTDTHPAGLSANPSRTVSLMMRAERLGSSPKLFARTPEQLDIRDLYISDCIIAMSPSVKQAVLEIFQQDLEADWDSEEDRAHYRQRICLMSSFVTYASPEQLTRQGGSALLPPRIAQLVRREVTSLRDRTEIPAEVALAQVERWNDMVLVIAVAAAGLIQYLMDSYPHDMRQAWLE